MGRWSTGVLVCGLVLTSCAGVEEAAGPIEPAPAAVAEPVGLAAVEEVDSPTLLRDFGTLLAAAATTGGDALERTLRVTADDHQAYDPECAPEWAHELLASAAGGPLGVDTDQGLLVGTVEVPAVLVTGRALHRTDAPCDGRLPQPERSSSPPSPTAAATAPAASTAPPSPPASRTTPPVAPPPAPSRNDDRELIVAYDAELQLWADTIWQPIFTMVLDSQRIFGAVGGGPGVGSNYDDLSGQLHRHRRYWLALEHPTARSDARTALVDGLELWAAELRLLGACASYVQGSGCSTLPGETREQWRARFATVTAETGIQMPSGEAAPQRAPSGNRSGPSQGSFNIGDIRLPSEYEVRRSLEE